MKIESIDIKYYRYDGFSMSANDGMIHRKALPYLSIVQSKVGSYGIQLDNGAECLTDEGGFFIAPSLNMQKITHYLNKSKGLFKARFVFLDVIINKKYHFDDVFDMPLTVEGNTAEIFDADFNDYENAGCICEKMRCLYNIIKHLTEISVQKNVYRNDKVYTLIEFIKENYSKHITISAMAEILKISESNLYAVFKKATGIPPIKYLNEYRLSVAATRLLQTDDSIKTVAENVGIEDQFYFSKLFKAKYRMSPQQYRKEQY